MFFFKVSFGLCLWTMLGRLRTVKKEKWNGTLVSSAVSGVTITKKVRVYGQVLYGVQAIVYDLYCKKGEQDGVR